MARIFFKKEGFEGLTIPGQLTCIFIFLSITTSVMFAFHFAYGAVDEFATTTAEQNFAGISFFARLFVSVIIGWVISAFFYFFMPKRNFFKDEYFCADCGQFLGYQAACCERCKCNRCTTTDPGVGTTIKTK